MQEIFNKKAFLGKKEETKDNFYAKLTDTNMFASFIETQILGGPEEQELKFFCEVLKKERTKSKPFLLQQYIPSKTIKTYSPNTDGLDASCKFLLKK